MKTTPAHEIPREKWLDYFNDLSRLYYGWSATVEVLAGQYGDQSKGKELPLQGFSYDPEGSQAGDVMVEVGDKGTPYHTHLIHRPRTVRATSLEPGLDFDIEIESEEGVTTIVRIRRRPALPPPDMAQVGAPATR